MKRLAYFLLFVAVAVLFPLQLCANDYLEVQRHYQVYSNGRNSIHFKIPVWAYGRVNDYHLDSAFTTIRWQVKGQSVEPFMYVGGSAYGDNRKDNDRGNASVKMYKKANSSESKGGVIVVTNEYNGNRLQIDRTDDYTMIDLKQVADDDCPRVTILEFDWFPPAELNNKKFTISIQTDIRTKSASSADYNPLFIFPTTFTGGDNTAAPQLYTPYLYMVNEMGVAGRGLAAVPYYSQAKPLAYSNPLINDTILTNDNSGTMYVPTSDTGYYAFDANFKVYRNEETEDVEWIRSNAVQIPAYHRIYDFKAEAQQDGFGSYTGANVVSWRVKRPEAKDLIQGDYFELQRAFKSDFSDAQTIQLLPMKTTDSVYQFVDDNRTAWNGTELRTDTIDTRLSVTESNYNIFDDQGNQVALVDMMLISRKLVKPSAPVYYRIRRTSSSVWDWDHDFAKSYELYKATYLAPLKKTQPNYQIDRDFASNRKLHFNIAIDNMEVGPRALSLDECMFGFTRVHSYIDDGCVNYITEFRDDYTDDNGTVQKHGGEVYVYALTKDGQEPFGPRPGRKAEPGRQPHRVPVGSTVERRIRFKLSNLSIEYRFPQDSLRTTKVDNRELDYVDHIGFEYSATPFYWFMREIITVSGVRTNEKAKPSPILDSIIEAKTPELKQMMYAKLGTLNGDYGRCIWDRSARLILRRKMQETGQSVDIVVPQDSIERLPDGSWLAHISDVADAPCTHYSYEAYIDQSHATLRMVDSMYLQPVAINGTKFYVNEAANITSFSASQGDANGQLKSGVQLQWTVSSLAVDSFVLKRVPKNSSDAPEIIYTGEDNHFFDETAVPDVHYEYTVLAHYTCNGNMTTNSRTAEGWRSPYGQIDGTVLLPDYAGMPGVQVSLSANGQTLRTVNTDASGAYLFDSLTYDLTAGTIYTVTPTSQYGTFSYNSTSSGIATVSLDVHHAIENAINFVNTSAVRLTGRVLYELSTIPVADACFVLNGDTVRRGNTIYRTGTDGNFELTVPMSMPCRLQVVKPGHTFANEGWLFVTGTDTTFSLVKPLDGVRFYDTTKVRLVGRVAGGNDQQALKHGFGLGTNNLGDDLQLVLMLEGDNTARIIHDPDDLSRDTLHRKVGTTDIFIEQKRITIRPDARTGEYAADLFPVKYKVVQATAKGYATLFPSGTGSETFDLTNAPLTLITDSLDGHTVTYNAIYDRIYHNPVQIKMTQLLYGMEKAGFGEQNGQYTDMDGRQHDLAYYTESDGQAVYTLGYPVFAYNRQYQFMVSAFEEYCYNNNRNAHLIDRVPLRSGSVVIRNGLHSATESQTYVLDNNGRNNTVLLKSDNIDFSNSGLAALRTVSAALQTEGNTVETNLFQAFVSGDVVQSNTLTSSAADVKLLDVIRDPGGMGSSSWLEAGSTYKFGYSSHTHWEVGAEIGAKWGEGLSQSIGVVSAPAGAGTYAGSVFETNRSLTLSLPFTWEWDWTNKYSYEYTTSTRIATSSSYTNVGANADVFLGATRSVITGLAKSVSVISDSLWQARQTAYQGGAIKLLAQGTDADGHAFYLVTGEKTVLGSALDNTFVYSQKYIIQSVIPSLAKRRLNLLENFSSKEAAQTAANERNEPVYWYKGKEEKIIDADTIRSTAYEMFVPKYSSKAFLDEVASLNTRIMNWLNILFFNEKEKVMARMSGQKYGTYSVSGGNAYTRNDSYSYGGSYTHMPQEGLFLYNLSQSGTAVAERLTDSNLRNFVDFLETSGGVIGESVKDVIKNQFSKFSDQFKLDDKVAKKPEDLTGKTANAQWKLVFEPILSFTNDEFRSTEASVSRKVGFTLSPDPHGDIAVSVYRASIDKVFDEQSKVSREETQMENDSIVYGSYVFFTEAGTSYCPHEGEERTRLYNAGTAVLGNGTLYAAKPEISTNTYEQTNVAPDKPAIFRLTLMNNADIETPFQGGEYMHLSLAGGNPDGAKVFIDGVPLAAGYPLYLVPGSPVVKTMEVYRGQADDYTDMELQLSLDDCPKVYSSLKFSVHFLPESSPVQVAFPRDKWVMNTLSARDSIGYYLPITIDGFDIHHKNFDHIEFQYKLSTENDDSWVTQCSFFADDSLYNKASGNKAMIENGRITPFRFYGERDPKELNYDLRAVSFCRYGSGFVTKTSPVISGIKDTRPPVLFGKAQPANGILTLEDNISLRFSEPIAGNWLDEDNNFQILGVTNSTGITQTTSPYFDGLPGHFAQTKARRELAITDLSLDMLIKPAEKNREMALLTHGDENTYFTFSLTADNRLKFTAYDDGELLETKLSKPMDELSTADFTRVIMVFNFDDQTMRFYAGTKDITEDEETLWFPQNDASPFIVGAALDGSDLYHGNMMELRVWTKPLSPVEISNTHLRRLTGFEYGLLDYYPMRECTGNEIVDLATGATLFTNGITWTMPKGISLSTTGKPVYVQPTLFSRADAEDYSLLFWFRSVNDDRDSVSLFGTSIGDSVTMELTLHDNVLSYRAGETYEETKAALMDGVWHHCALVVSKTFNSAFIAVDGEKLLTFASIPTGALSGTKMWFAKGMEGNLDDICLFEQALPDELVAEFGKQSPNGEEMGLINLLTFSQIKRNSASVMELVFSPNNQRVFKDPNGKVIAKEQPLLVGDLSADADKEDSAPVRDRGQLTKLPFTWNYQLSELMINIKAQPREINKRTMYLTVRDVEDVNGNRLPSPVMWTVYANLNSVIWNERRHVETLMDNEDSHRFTMLISNTTGMTRQFTIEHIPDWLTVSPTQGTLDAEEEKSVTFTINASLLKIGAHQQIIYLIDDQGLSEPLMLEINKETEPPYTDVDLNKYPFNMSLCGRVMVEENGKTVINTDEEDFVYAIYNNECVGVAHCTNRGELYLTIHGSEAMMHKSIRFQLWKAATGKVYNLLPDREITFAHGFVFGCGNDEPVVLTAGGSEMQTISLNKGWNWISTYLQVPSSLQTAITAEQPWAEGDLIKNPATRQFCTYSEQTDNFVGTLSKLHFSHMYMVYNATANNMHIFGDELSQDSMQIILRGDGHWSELPCLYEQVISLREAMGDYYSYASPGDIIKSHNHFATFSTDKRWVGDLTSLTPGEGYLFRRMGSGSVAINFYKYRYSAPKHKALPIREESELGFHASSATNMTMIATIGGLVDERISGLEVYIDDQLVGKAKPIDSMYFLTIQSDAIGGTLRFVTEDGQELTIVNRQIVNYVPDSHLGSLKAPVILVPVTDNPSPVTGNPSPVTAPYKLLEDDHVVIIRNGEKYDVTGKKL